MGHCTWVHHMCVRADCACIEQDGTSNSAKIFTLDLPWLNLTFFSILSESLGFCGLLLHCCFPSALVQRGIYIVWQATQVKLASHELKNTCQPCKCHCFPPFWTVWNVDHYELYFYIHHSPWVDYYNSFRRTGIGALRWTLYQYQYWWGGGDIRFGGWAL